MNKVLRTLLLAVVILAIVLPMTVSAAKPATLTIPGKIFNGNNGGPESPVTVRLYRDSGRGFEMIREENFDPQRAWTIDPDTLQPVPDVEQWFHTFSSMGDFLFQVNAVRGLYMLEIEEFLCSDGSAATDTMWWNQIGSEILPIKVGTGGPGPWSYTWYYEGPAHYTMMPQILFEYGCLGVAGAEIRDNAGWMYVAGKVFTGANAAGGVEGANVYVSRIGYNEETNIADPNMVLATWTAVTGDKGWWGVGIVRQPGFYKVELQPGDFQVMSANPLFFQVFDVYRTGGAGFGPGSSWLPWDYMQPDWIYDRLNFLVTPAV